MQKAVDHRSGSFQAILRQKYVSALSQNQPQPLPFDALFSKSCVHSFA